MSILKSFKGKGRKVTAKAVSMILVIILVMSMSVQAFAATTATFDFTVDKGTGYANVFGGAINQLDASADIDALRSVGVDFARRDVYLTQIVPATTVANYKNNVNNVADPSTWNWSQYAWVDTYHNKGLKTMIILSYNIDWLAYNNEMHGVPKDWAVYQDIIKKIYQHFQGKVDYIEVWNEPDHTNFLRLDNSPYSDRLTAYKDIYYNAATAIRSVDATIPIGGPVVSTPSLTSWADSMLKDARIKNNINFLSYHYYQMNPDGEPQIAQWRNVAAANGKSNMPIYLTEWNYDWQYIGTPMNNGAVEAIPYVAQRMNDMIYNHLNGSGYFAFNKLNYGGATDFYSLNADGSLTPKMATYRLMSKKLGLGAGDFSVKGASWANGASLVCAGSAVNANGKSVAYVICTNSTGDNLTVNANHLQANTSYTVELYEASQWQNADPVRDVYVVTTNSSGNASITFWLPYKSVVGLVFNPVSNDLAYNKTVTVDSSTTGLVGANAVDNNTTTRWASAETSGTHWIKVDLGSVQNISKVLLNWETAYGKDYKVQTSTDNSIWTDVASVSGNTTAGWKAHSFGTKSARYVRVYCTAGAWNNLISLWDFKVYAN